MFTNYKKKKSISSLSHSGQHSDDGKLKNDITHHMSELQTIFLSTLLLKLKIVAEFTIHLIAQALTSVLKTGSSILNSGVEI
jgi:hypothetical protein